MSRFLGKSVHWTLKHLFVDSLDLYPCEARDQLRDVPKP